MSEAETLPLPETVRFKAHHVDYECIAHTMFGEYGINFRVVQTNFGTNPTVEINHIDGFARVSINGGQVWFDTTDESAMEIKQLFEKHLQPA